MTTMYMVVWKLPGREWQCHGGRYPNAETAVHAMAPVGAQIQVFNMADEGQEFVVSRPIIIERRKR